MKADLICFLTVDLQKCQIMNNQFGGLMNIIVKQFSKDDIERFTYNSGMKTLDVQLPFAIQYFDKVSFTDLYGNRIQCKLKKKYPRSTKAVRIDDICEMMLCIYNPSDEQIENLTK